MSELLLNLFGTVCEGYHLGGHKYITKIPITQYYQSYSSYLLNENRPSDNAYIEFTLDTLKQSTKNISLDFDKKDNYLIVDSVKIPYSGIPPAGKEHVSYCAEILKYLKTELKENKRRLLTEINLFI